jgi:hypothetical protein
VSLLGKDINTSASLFSYEMQHRLSIMVDKDTLSELHQLMNYSLAAEEGITLYRLYEGTSKQGWYREVMRAGLRVMRQKFEREKHRIEQLPEEKQ